jgi:penicillin V acylase-like amidase (Ntn superfamily)
VTRTVLGTIATFALLAATAAHACTTFCVRGPDGLVFGRNYDYFFGEALVLVNPRGVEKVSLMERAPARWTSKYGSVTFSMFGKDNPAGGVNERGLVIEVMELEDTRYPEPDSRPALRALEWIQYGLDNYASVEEALAGAKRVRIAQRAPVHFLLADRGGDTAAVEFLSGRMMIRRGDGLPDRALSNSPYDDSREYAASQPSPPPSPKGEGGLPRGQLGSLERFTRAARAVKAFEASGTGSAVERSFEILDEVAQQGHTQWQVVYDLARATIHFRTTNNRERRSIDYARLDYTCRASGAMLDVDTGRGDVTAAFMPYAPEANERLMLATFARSPHFSMPPQVVRAEAAQLESTRRCVAAG